MAEIQAISGAQLEVGPLVGRSLYYVSTFGSKYIHIIVAYQVRWVTIPLRNWNIHSCRDRIMNQYRKQPGFYEKATELLV